MTGPPSQAHERFQDERARLLGLAYRITGSHASAEDVVQEVWITWLEADAEAIANPPAWLTTVTSRRALDHLRVASRRRETYVGPWLPEVVMTDGGPEEQALVAESLTVGFLAVLERLAPVERVVFLLADVFRVPYEEIAPVVDRSTVACRQIASRARTRVRADRPRYAPTDDDAWQVALAFLAATQAGDIDGLVALLAPDAVAVSDGGAARRAARRPIVAERIPRFVVNLAGRLPADAGLEVCAVNGQPSLVVRSEGAVTDVITISVADGVVQRLWIVRNPQKLAALDHIVS